jgi:serine/threonine protein phosphatase PrpC
MAVGPTRSEGGPRLPARARRLVRLTTYHTLVEALIAAGRLTTEQASTHPACGHLARYAGMAAEALTDTRTIELRQHDLLLLASDGLTGVVDDAKLQAILARGLKPDPTCQALIAAANAANARDRITATVIDWNRPAAPQGSSKRPTH